MKNIFLLCVIGSAVLGDELEETDEEFPKALYYCSWGQPAVSVCFSGNGRLYCNRGYLCDTSSNPKGFCCLPPTPPPGPPSQTTAPPLTIGGLRCKDGSPSRGFCNNGRCETGFVCSVSDNLCCRSGSAASCNFEAVPSERCSNGLCTLGCYCSRDGWCCPARQRCPNNGTPAGSCRTDSQCKPGFACVDGVCCEMRVRYDCVNGGAPIGRCQNGACPNGYGCSANGWCCKRLTTNCPFNARPNGTCLSNQRCSNPAFTCIKGFCCELQSLHCNDNATKPTGACLQNRCPSSTSRCEQPYNLCCPIRSPSLWGCPVGTASIGPCLGGLYGIGGVCPATAACSPQGQCCTSVCPDGTLPRSTCDIRGTCSHVGWNFVCFWDRNICCPMTYGNRLRVLPPR